MNFAKMDFLFQETPKLHVPVHTLYIPKCTYGSDGRNENSGFFIQTAAEESGRVTCYYDVSIVLLLCVQMDTSDWLID